MENKKKSIAEMLQEAKALREQEAKIKAEMKAKKTAIATEYQNNLPEAEKQKQIAEAEKILENAKQNALTAKMVFKNTMKQIRNDVAFAKEILEFVNYKQNHSLPKAKNAFRIEKSILHFNREGLIEIKIDLSKANWQQQFTAELHKQGIENGIARNIVYKASKLQESNVEIK